MYQVGSIIPKSNFGLNAPVAGAWRKKLKIISKEWTHYLLVFEGYGMAFQVFPKYLSREMAINS
jgi:hypothetical protein